MASPHRCRTTQLDRGFTLVELMVAFALFLVMTTAVLSIVATSAKVAADDGMRPLAANLAQREMEIVREAFARDFENFRKTNPTGAVAVNPNPVRDDGKTTGNSVIEGHSFRIERSLQWRQVGSTSASTCDAGAGSELDYLAVTVQVFWAGGRSSVDLDTFLTPPVGAYQDAVEGHIALRVIDAAGRPRQGVPVTARSTSGVVRSGSTQSDGCFLADRVPTGTWTVTASEPGSVTPAGQTKAELSASVQDGVVWRGTVEYDKAASIRTTFVTADGFALPTGVTGSTAVPVTLGNSALLPAGSRAVEGSGSPRTLSNLWPYPSGYQLWAGRCLDNDPQYVDPAAPPVVPVDGDEAQPGRELPVTVAGETEPVETTVRLGPVEVRSAANTALVAVQPNRTQTQDASCQTGPRVALGTTNAQGLLRTSLPFGSWTVQRASGGTGAATRVPAPPPETFAPPVQVNLP